MLILFVIICSLNRVYPGLRIEQPQMRIVGGEVCTEEDHKSIVSISHTNFVHRCGGTLINKNFVLTAAHCVIEDHRLVVIAGISHKNGYYNVSVRPIMSYFIHPKFDLSQFRNDIAVVKVGFPIEETDHIKYVTLPNDTLNEEIVNICPHGLVMGWGFTIPGQKSISKDLHCVRLPIIHPQQCSYFYYRFNISREDTICTYSQERRDACTGDSGGPLLCNGTQLGIVSWGIGCALPNAPGVYTRVDRYLPFVRKTLETNDAEYEMRHNVILYVFIYHIHYIIFY